MNKKNQNLTLSNEMILRLQQFHSPNTTSKAANVAPQETSASFLQSESAIPNSRSPQSAADSSNNPPIHQSAPQSVEVTSFRDFLLTHARVPLRDTRSGA